MNGNADFYRNTRLPEQGEYPDIMQDNYNNKGVEFEDVGH